MKRNINKIRPARRKLEGETRAIIRLCEGNSWVNVQNALFLAVVLAQCWNASKGWAATGVHRLAENHKETAHD